MVVQSKTLKTPPSTPGKRRKIGTCELVEFSPNSVGNNLTGLEQHFLGRAARHIREAGNKDAAMTSLKALAEQSNGKFFVQASGGEKVAIHFNTGHMHYLDFFPHTRSKDDASYERPIVYELSQIPGDTSYVGLRSEFVYQGGVILSEQATRHEGDLLDAVLIGLTPKQQENVIMKILKAVSKLHAMKIVHRDIKLDNVFVTFENDEVELLLGDVGFCVRDVQPGQRSHQRCGTELWALDSLRPPAEGYLLFENDVYATAIMIWSILTRSGPKPYEVRIEGNQWAIWELDGNDINAQFTETYPTFWPKVVQALHTSSRAKERPTLEEMLKAFKEDNSNNDN